VDQRGLVLLCGCIVMIVLILDSSGRITLRNRFSLRTLLIAVTVAAMVLWFAIYAATNNGPRMDDQRVDRESG
jgi:hypothetical protein